MTHYKRNKDRILKNVNRLLEATSLYKVACIVHNKRDLSLLNETVDTSRFSDIGITMCFFYPGGGITFSTRKVPQEDISIKYEALVTPLEKLLIPKGLKDYLTEYKELVCTE